jgi:hypothetical protein
MAAAVDDLLLQSQVSEEANVLRCVAATSWRTAEAYLGVASEWSIPILDW